MTVDFGSLFAVATLAVIGGYLGWKLVHRIDEWLTCPQDEQPTWSAVDGYTLLTFGDQDPVLVPDDFLFEVTGALAWIDSLPETDEIAA